MSYTELLQLYFDRSNAIQWYWTVYVIIIGGLLAFSSIRQRPDLGTAVLITVLYVLFAYKNLGAIEDVTNERWAIRAAIHDYEIPEDQAESERLRRYLQEELQPAALHEVQITHIAGDALTIAACWAMEMRRRRQASSAPPAA
jgi:hypothetical protein